jgi:putative transposase
VNTQVKRAFRYRFSPTEVQAVPLQQALRHLQAAFGNFWSKRARFPRFKSRKRSRASAEYTRSAFRWRDGVLTPAKMSEPRWFVSLLCEDPGATPLPAAEAVVGIDVGLDHLVVLSTGEKITNPRHERCDRVALAKAQRALSRKQKSSNDRARAHIRVARVHARIADRRADHLHKITARLVREDQTPVIEDLAASTMIGNRRVARAISDAGRRQFRQLLEYKARWYGRDVVVVDRWFPSSKLCSACGALATTMLLRVRAWTCARGATHGRDVNAARNVLAAGLAVSVCGAGARPQRNTPSGQSATKQKSCGVSCEELPSVARGRSQSSSLLTVSGSQKSATTAIP